MLLNVRLVWTRGHCRKKSCLGSARPHDVIPKQFLTMHYLENYPNATFLIGIVNSINHLNWIFSR